MTVEHIVMVSDISHDTRKTFHTITVYSSVFLKMNPQV